MTDKVMIEAFRNDGQRDDRGIQGDASFVIPEIFYRESKCFQILWTPDRSIQGQAKSGLKIAGVTNEG